MSRSLRPEVHLEREASPVRCAPAPASIAGRSSPRHGSATGTRPTCRAERLSAVERFPVRARQLPTSSASIPKVAGSIVLAQAPAEQWTTVPYATPARHRPFCESRNLAAPPCNSAITFHARSDPGRKTWSRDLSPGGCGTACRPRSIRNEALRRHPDVDVTPFERRVLRHEAQRTDLHIGTDGHADSDH